ncbi:MAG: adenylate/guanylate cyclase domain-containing protein [Alphaproteobacteria bacterium]|nr:adenylate/guanylate cyclase domain-containing protein [Alphaproteobacteria bacterium]
MATQDFNLGLRSVARTHKGLVRAHNEDVYLERPDIGLWAVADGMGGHRKGDVAAARISEVLSAIPAPDGEEAYLAAVRGALEGVNGELYAQGAGISDDRTMGATIAALFVVGDRFTCVWAGDSRLYRVRDGTCAQLTKDHTLVQEMVDAGTLSEAEARNHPRRNVITRAIGADREIVLETIQGGIRPGDIFILATDGLTTVCSAEDLAAALDGGDLDAAAERLVALYLERGAADNLSLVIVETEERASAEARVQRRLATILAADVVGYSRLMEANEEATLRTLKAHRSIIDGLIMGSGGRVFSTAGDSVVAEFPSAVEAVRAAVAIQEQLEARNAELAEENRMLFRIGVNLGDIMVDGDNLYGDGINVAARIEGLCEPGGVYVSGSVYGQVEGKLDLSFEDKGEQAVKNIVRPVRVYRVYADRDQGSEAAGEASSAAPVRPSVAVLPFENMSRDPDQEYFTDGITEDIITELSTISGLSVVSRHSSSVYKEKRVPVKQVGRDLNVRYVLEGSVRRAGDRLRIAVKLIDAETDHHLWVERFDRDVEDIYLVQDEVARQVAQALEVALTPGAGGGPPKDPPKTA